MMREMKNSGIDWLPYIPTNWCVKAVKYLSTDHTGGAWGEEADGGDYDRLCVRIADFDYPHMQVKEENVNTLRKYTEKEIQTRELKNGDLIIEKSGGGAKTPVGRVVVYRGKDGLMFANFSDRFRLTSEYYVEFAKYVFFAWYNVKGSLNYFNQTTGIQNIDIPKFFGKLLLPVPEYSEQQQIAFFLDSKISQIDSAISSGKSIIEKMKEYRKSVITQAVTKGLDPTEDSIQVKHLFNVYTGATPSTKDPSNWDGDIPWVTPADFKTEDRVVAVGQRNISSKGYDEVSTVLVPEGSLIVSKRAPVGTVVLTANPLCTNQGCFALTPKGDANTELYYYVFQALKEKMEVLANSTTFTEISLNAFKNMRVPFFSKNDAKIILSFLNNECAKIDEAITRQEAIIEKLEEYKKSLIYNAVTGKIDCRDFEAKLPQQIDSRVQNELGQEV